MVETNAAYINDILQALLDHTYACLEYTTYGQPDQAFLAFTRPPDDCCNYVAIWFDEMKETVEFPMEFTGFDQCNEARRMIRVKVKLVRSCWPVIRDNAIQPFPEPSEIATAAEKLTVDANILWCCLSSGFSDPEGPFTDAMRELDVKMESLVPDDPRGGCAGMTATLWVELDPCCDGEVSA